LLDQPFQVIFHCEPKKAGVEVLKRPKFGFDPSTVDTFLNDLEKAAVMAYPTKRAKSTLDEGLKPIFMTPWAIRM